MARTRIQLCGRLTAELEGHRLETDLPGRQGRLLFAYLVANRVRPVGRAALIEALWDERPPREADAALSALLSKLRRALGPGTLAGRGSVQLRLPPDAWVDLEAMSEALHRAESALARRDWTGTWGPARAAQHIASRTFLTGENAQWIEEWRVQLEAAHIRALELAAQACLAIGGSELATAERSARTLIEKAPFRESGYRHLMEALAAQQNGAEAVLVYNRLRVLLHDELGTAPGQATQTLYRELLG